ncbi:MAG: hypothetical protein A2X94_06945 [Bdellovibrionales bacterium GWB1_55_8]|nr:MAG: hypothetical protein A2X94_06945 [Bdellovibrionales bacterium GWB1_55_8]
MRFLFTALRFFPYWAIPVAFILADLGLHFRRKNNRVFVPLWSASGLLVVLVLLWFVFRGDKNSDLWVRALIGG